MSRQRNHKCFGNNVVRTSFRGERSDVKYMARLKESYGIGSPNISTELFSPNERKTKENIRLRYKPSSTENSRETSAVSKKIQSNRSVTSDINKPYSIRELACNLRDAVVIVSGQGVITSGTGAAETISVITRTGNGFFIKGHYIICPADLVLMHPTQFNTNGRLPEYHGVPTEGDYPNALIRVSRILVDVSNVNGCGHSYSYEADIVGIDGAANIAILRININGEWNRCNPPVRKFHPFLQWGKSRSSCPGDTILVIGNIPSPTVVGLTSDVIDSLVSENAVALGTIADNRYVFPGGQVPGELILFSNILTTGMQRGLPVINIDGTVIGMVLNIDTVVCYNIALSEFFMRRPVKGLILSYQDNFIPDNYRGFVEPVKDPINSYYRFNKAWLGLGGIIMTQKDYDTDINIEPTSATFARVPLLNNGNLTIGPDCKEIVGYRILAVASPENTVDVTGIFIPGSSPTDSLVPDLKPSPLYGVIAYGDIITHINGCPLGDRKGQISPSLVMWRVHPGDPVTIIYKKQMERFQTIHEVTVCASSYEPFLDFPFYAFSVPTLRPMVPTLI